MDTDRIAEAIVGLFQARHRFVDSQTAVRDLAAMAVTRAVELDDAELVGARLGERYLPDWQAEERKRIHKALEEWFVVVSATMEDLTEAQSDSETSDLAPVLEQTVDDAAESLISILEANGVDGAPPFTYFERFMSSKTRRPRVDLMLTSLLTTAVSEFEVLISAVIRESLAFNPAALSGNGATYSWADVAAYESIEEFTKFAIDRQVDNVMRGDLQSWMDHVRKITRADEQSMSRLLSPVKEVVQRRHLLIHNGGRVSHQYLAKTERRDVALGDELVVDQDYLVHALDNLVCLGICTVEWALRAVTHRVQELRPQLDSQLSTLTFDQLMSGNNRVVLGVCTELGSLAVSDGTALVFKVNAWLARKLIEGTGAIESEVQAWDVTSMSDRFRLAKLCLLEREEDLDEAVRLCERLISSGDMTTLDVSTWPLLKPLRAKRAEAIAEMKDVRPVVVAVEATKGAGGKPAQATAGSSGQSVESGIEPGTSTT